MAKPSRSLEEIVDLQDKAISALTQANLALQLALEAIQSARREVGTPIQFQFAQPNPLKAMPDVLPYLPGVPYGKGGNASGGIFTNGLPAVTGKANWINGSYNIADMQNAMVTLTNTGKTLSSSAEKYQGLLENWKSEYEKLGEEPATESNSVALKGCVQ